MSMTDPADALRASQDENKALWDALNRLWGWLGVAEVREMRLAEPDLYRLVVSAHQRMSHGSP